MKIKFLGSGCWQGVPAPFCNCKICRRAIKLPNSRDARMRSSLLLENNGKKVIVDITPDIRMQTAKFSISKPDAFIITHWHWDHLFGLGELHYFAENNKIIIYGTKETKKWVNSRFAYVPLRFKELKIGEINNIYGMKIMPFLVKHSKESVGFLFIGKKKRIAYICDFRSIPKKSLKLIKNCDILICDGTYLENPIEYDDSHLKGKEIIEFIKTVNPKITYIDRISCRTGKTQKELKEKYKPIKIAYDRLVLEI